MRKSLIEKFPHNNVELIYAHNTRVIDCQSSLGNPNPGRKYDSLDGSQSMLRENLPPPLFTKPIYPAALQNMVIYFTSNSFLSSTAITF